MFELADVSLLMGKTHSPLRCGKLVTRRHDVDRPPMFRFIRPCLVFIPVAEAGVSKMEHDPQLVVCANFPAGSGPRRLDDQTIYGMM